MARLEKASPEIQKLVQDVASEFGLSQFIEFQALNAKNAKEVVKVQRAGKVAEVLSNKEVVVLVNEDAFDRVNEATQIMWLKGELTKVSYDSEKDKIIIGCPMISIPLGFYQKYGNVALENAELALHVIQQIEDEEKERKAAEKAMKKGKKKKTY
jgi:hypothetical protein